MLQYDAKGKIFIPTSSINVNVDVDNASRRRQPDGQEDA